MSAYNIVQTVIKSPDDGNEYLVRIQFKYGDVWQYTYKIGDNVKWGGNDVGNHKAKIVVVDGCLEGDLPTPSFPEDYEIMIINNVIKSVVPASGKWNFFEAKSNFIEIE